VSRVLSRLRRAVFALRPEEFLTLLLFAPMAYTLARMSAARADTLSGPDAVYPGALPRLAALLAATALFLFVIRVKPRWKFVRDAMPFLFCANIYVSLHDLIHFFHAPDITAALYRWDVALLGFEPTIWAERFIQPALTDIFTVCYWLFYVLAPMLGLILYLRKDFRAFRYTMVTVVLCLYLGYVGYVAWPASAPRLFIPTAYSVPLRGLAILDYTRTAAAAIPLTAYGAFPSLHCAVALLAVLLAWRYQRWFAWVQLPFAAGLVVGTVYLRHHWVVDIFAGFGMTLLALWAGPRLEDWWSKQAAAPGGAGAARDLDAAVAAQPAPKGREAAPSSRVAAKVMES
jgi:membrane-associated phospholipid phosphatase